ncbi:MAG: HAD family phosphatase [Acidobacteria bacterium]|nr:HAD family phosphatase [Acidobacteriota bacterium]
MPLRGIVFDFDGVIADTEPSHLAAFQDVLAGTGLALGARDYYDRYMGYDDVGTLQALGRDQGRPLDDREIRRLVAAKARRFEARLRGGNVLFPGAAACIGRLAAVAPLGIASGALRAEIEAILTAASLRDRFAAIVGADDVPRSKPAPDTYQRAVALLGAAGTGADPSTCVAIEDTVWGIEAAHAAGLPCVALTHSYPAAALAAADAVLGGLDELQPAVLQRLCGGLDAAGRPVR